MTEYFTNGINIFIIFNRFSFPPQGALTELTGATKAELRTATNDLSRLRREMETNIIDQAAVRSSLLLKVRFFLYCMTEYFTN